MNSVASNMDMIPMRVQRLLKSLTAPKRIKTGCYLPYFQDDVEWGESQIAPYFTSHAHLRSSNRGISRQMIEDTIKHGKKVCKQGLCFYIMIGKSIPASFTRQYAERIENTVVVLKRPDIILTVYKNNKAMRQIQKKSKRLL